MLELVLPVFVLIAVGYGLHKFRVMDSEASYQIVGLLMNVTYPATLFVALVKTPFPSGVWKAPFWSFAALGASGVVTYLFARFARLDRPSTGSLVVASAFGNTGYLGVPLLFWSYGAIGRTTGVIYDLFGVSTVLYGLGFAVLAAFGGEEFSWKSVLLFFRTPTFLTAVVAIAVRLITPWWVVHVHSPALIGEVINRSLDFLMPLTAPLAMIALGVNLRFRAALEYLPTVCVSCAAKLVVMPMTAYLLVHFFGPGGITGKAIVLESAMPGGLVAGVLCGRYGCNPRLGAAITVGTTLGALITLPLWTGLLGH